jgi:ribosomal protein L28
MPATCALTGKTRLKTVKRSHSMRANIVHRKANLQPLKVGNRRIKVSARAMRTMKKNKAKVYTLMID